MNYLNYYNLEDYLFNEVTGAFRDRGYLTPEEFFSIVVWKANRAKTKIKAKLAKRGNLAAVVQELTTQVHRPQATKTAFGFFSQRTGTLGCPWLPPF